jgi:hypothetical protein
MYDPEREAHMAVHRARAARRLVLIAAGAFLIACAVLVLIDILKAGEETVRCAWFAVHAAGWGLVIAVMYWRGRRREALAHG